MKFTLLTLSIMLSGCGIATSNEPAFELPTDMIVTDVDSPTETTAVASGLDNSRTGRVYLLNEDDRLVVVERQFFQSPTPQIILDALVQPPLATEISRNGFLKTELPTTLAPIHTGTDLETGVIDILVADEAGLRITAQADAPRTQRIFSQIVCSLDWFELSNGEPVAGIIIRDSEGQIIATDTETASIEGAASPSDFSNCR